VRSAPVLAFLLLLPGLARAGALAVCDGVLTVDSAGYTLCSVPWRSVDESDLAMWAPFIETISIEQAGELAVTTALVWAACWLFRRLRLNWL